VLFVLEKYLRYQTIIDPNIPRTHPYIDKEQKKSDILPDIALLLI